MKNDLKKDENIREVKTKITWKYILDCLKNLELPSAAKGDVRDKYLDLCNNFNNQLNLFYQDKIPNKNLNILTQYLYYSFLLEKERLKKFGIYKNIEYSNLIYLDDENMRNFQPGVMIFKNGSNTLYQVHTQTNKCFHHYFYKDSKILSLKEEVKKEYYILNSLKVSDDKYICPNCGNQEDIKDILCECNYCGTKILVNNMNSKLSSIFNYKFFGTDRSGVNVFPAILAAYCIIFGFVYHYLWILAIFIYIFSETTNRQTIQSTKMIEDIIKSKDEYFSSELFLGNLDSKIKMLLYCDNHYDLNALYKIPRVDNSKLIEDFQNVIKADMTKYVLKKFKTNDIYDFLDVEVSYDLYCLNNDYKIEKINKTFYLTLKRKSGIKTNITDDAIIYTCQNCGSSINFLTGKCDSCGNELILEDFDWIICDFSTGYKNYNKVNSNQFDKKIYYQRTK